MVTMPANSRPGLVLLVICLPVLLALLVGPWAVKGQLGVPIEEATIGDIRLAFKQNRLTSRQLVEFYLGQIQRLNPVLRGVIEVNPDTLLQADKADRERRAQGSYSYGSLPHLHGIPILLKDNIGTKDSLNTTAGSVALLGSGRRRRGQAETGRRSCNRQGEPERVVKFPVVDRTEWVES